MFFRRTNNHIPAASSSLSPKRPCRPITAGVLSCHCRFSHYLRRIRVSRIRQKMFPAIIKPIHRFFIRKESVLSSVIWNGSAGRSGSAYGGKRPGRTFFPASLTVEAAIELPIFFVLCAILLQFAAVYRTAAQFSDRLASTAQEMALCAYKEEYDDANAIIRGALSDAWAYSRVVSGTQDREAVTNASLLGSSYLKEDDLIRLLLSYQAKPKFSLVRIPWTFFVQKAVVRGWTGRLGSAGGGGKDSDTAGKKVLVTDTGTVYHTDPNCSHLKVTVLPVTRQQLKKARNKSRHKYKSCPHCGRSGGDRLYVDPYGECWHTSLNCPSLKRSVNTVPLEECSHLHECADCRKKREG